MHARSAWPQLTPCDHAPALISKGVRDLWRMMFCVVAQGLSSQLLLFNRNALHSSILPPWCAVPFVSHQVMVGGHLLLLALLAARTLRLHQEQ